jgi:hypothetical protein
VLIAYVRVDVVLTYYLVCGMLMQVGENCHDILLSLWHVDTGS